MKTENTKLKANTSNTIIVKHNSIYVNITKITLCFIDWNKAQIKYEYLMKRWINENEKCFLGNLN